MDSRSGIWPVGSMNFSSVQFDYSVSTEVRQEQESSGKWRTTFEDGHFGCKQNLTCFAHVAGKGAVLVGLCFALATTHAGEQWFGDWDGEIDLASSTPVSIQAYHFEADWSSSLWLICTPPGWNEGSTGVTPAEDSLPPPDQPRYGGVLMEHSSTTRLEREQKPCVVEAIGVAQDGDERIVRSKGLCGGSSVDLAQIDEWSDILNLLTTPLSDEQPRISVHRHDGSKFTFVAPKGYYTSLARTWMRDTCKRLRKSEGRVVVPGPTYGAWFTQYTYDEFHEKILVGGTMAGAASGANEVVLTCGGKLSVVHRTEDCSSRQGADAASLGSWGSCRIEARVDGGPAVQQEALCRSLCFVVAFATDSDVVAAMLTGKRAKMRVSGPNDMRRRDFEFSLWGFDSAHGWVNSECASASDV